MSGLVTLLVFIPGVLGFLMLNMAGDLPKQVDLTSGRPVYTGDPWVAVALIYYLVIWVWIMEPVRKKCGEVLWLCGWDGLYAVFVGEARDRTGYICHFPSS